jgi:hypothetical protein
MSADSAAAAAAGTPTQGPHPKTPQPTTQGPQPKSPQPPRSGPQPKTAAYPGAAAEDAAADAAADAGARKRPRSAWPKSSLAMIHARRVCGFDDEAPVALTMGPSLQMPQLSQGSQPETPQPSQEPQPKTPQPTQGPNPMTAEALLEAEAVAWAARSEPDTAAAAENNRYSLNPVLRLYQVGTRRCVGRRRENGDIAVVRWLDDVEEESQLM